MSTALIAAKTTAVAPTVTAIDNSAIAAAELLRISRSACRTSPAAEESRLEIFFRTVLKSAVTAMRLFLKLLFSAISRRRAT